jgi:hypothetical protein
MSRQHVEYLTSATPETVDGLDTGEVNAASVRPVTDGEPAQAAVLERPTENLRTRTEIVRDELEALKYISDADRALLLTSTGDVTWDGITPGFSGEFSATQNFILKPFTAPEISTASRLIICQNTASQITIRTRQNGTSGQPRAYSGANDISFDFTPVNTGLGNVIITVTGAPANNFHVQFDNNVSSGVTVSQMLTALNGNAPFLAAGLEAVIDGGIIGATPDTLGPNGGPIEIGFPQPPSPVVGNKVYLTIAPAELLTRFMSGAADAEKHIITPSQLVQFFAADGGTLNKLIEGDVLCVRYDDLVMTLDGGRRQSIFENPEGMAMNAGNNLFLMRRFPARLPGALPLAAVVNGQLIFVSGRVFNAGETGPLVSSGASYQGSSPNAWADTTTLAAGSFESAIDSIVATLGAFTGTTGAHKIGMQVLTGAGPATFSTPAGPLDTVVGNIVTEMNGKAGLALANTFTKGNIVTPNTAATTAITATGNTTGAGVSGQGGTTSGDGVYGIGGGPNGNGVRGDGAGEGHGVTGLAANVAAWSGFTPNVHLGFGVVGRGGDVGGLGHGVVGVGDGASGGAGIVGLGSEGVVVPAGDNRGVLGVASGSNGAGVEGQGAGAGPGVYGAGSTTGYGVKGKGGASSTAGVYGEGGSAGGVGVLGVGISTGYAGVSGLGGPDGTGVLGQGVGANPGVRGVGGSGLTAYGVTGEGGTGGSSGVYGVTLTGDEAGVVGRGASGSNGAGVYGEGGSGNGNGIASFPYGTGAGLRVYGTAPRAVVFNSLQTITSYLMAQSFTWSATLPGNVGLGQTGSATPGALFLSSSAAFNFQMERQVTLPLNAVITGAELWYGFINAGAISALIGITKVTPGAFASPGTVWSEATVVTGVSVAMAGGPDPATKQVLALTGVTADKTATTTSSTFSIGIYATGSGAGLAMFKLYGVKLTYTIADVLLLSP